jgi:glucan phosphoethanolaminetransferase (alkaline phosphatase superfamily)
MFHYRHWLGGGVFLVTADAVRFATHFASGDEGVYGDWSTDQILSALLVPFYAFAFTGLVLVVIQIHVEAARRSSKWVALLPVAGALSVYLSSGGGVSAAVSPWIAIPLFVAIMLAGSVLAWRGIEAALRISQPALRVVIKTVAFLCALGLLVTDLNLYVGLYLPLHTLLAAASVGFAMIAFDEDLKPSGRKSVLAFISVSIVAIASIPFTRERAPVVYMGAMAMGSATVQNARIWFILASLMPRSAPRAAQISNSSTDIPDFQIAPNVVVISLDGVRFDHTSLAGYANNTTPNLMSLANRSWNWTRAYSPAANTATSLNSLFSGTLADDCYVGDNLFIRSQERGYRTFCDFTYSRASLSCHAPGCDALMDTRDRNQTFTVLLNELAISNEPVFAFVHLLETHQPYEASVSDELRARTNGWSEYDRALLAADETLAKFVQSASGASSRPIAFIVMSDHGESFGEHGRFGHDSSVFNDQIHVPLLLHVDGMAPKHIDVPVSTMWLGPTLLEMLGQNATGGLPTTTVDDRPVFARNGGWQTVVSGKWKYVTDKVSGEFWLFDLSTDHKETLNVIADNPDVVEQLAEMLDTEFGP